MPREIPKTYEPQQIEPRWARAWVEQQLFRADAKAAGPVFSIVIPPPNVTGSLHIGHMLEHTEIDILTRWHRMRGFNTLFLPGTDHAAISTQRVVARELAAQGIDYRKLGREEFEKRTWKWKEEYGGKITEQMRQIGESCDWTRERFTLSPELSRVVIDVFVRLYEEGLIYRGHYIVNWCPQCQTTISDLETIHEERQGSLWYVRYPVVGTSQHIVVATTRPETMLGDTGVAVHPEDERYRHLVGKRARLPLMNREIPIVADTFVDREFGTGAVKVTPAHDPNDFELGKRHNLPEIDVMTDDGHMSAAAGAYAGLERFEARKRIVEDLKAQGLLEKTVPYTHAIGVCERCKTIIEPRASTQWFCKMKPLADPAIAVVESGEIRITPENWREVYFNWMHNIRDWPVSRQLWWGHRIPAWHCRECKEIIVAREAPAKCKKCGSGKLEQDPDVLDTWFSSALWPFSTLGWPRETEDLRTYYPTTLLITGYEILFFWVARMIMMGLKFTGKVPFRTVYIHPIVRASDRQKMSKSKGTGIDPLDINRKYGTDAMRFTLMMMAAPGKDLIWTEDKIESSRNFANKIWNAARFLFVNLDKFEPGGATMEELASPEVRAAAPHRFRGELPLVERWIFSRAARTVAQMHGALQEYRFHEAAHVIYHFVWGDFCDWYIEWQKPLLTSSDRETATAAWRNIFSVFEAALRLLHPFMPFLTEELWHRLPQAATAKSIALAQYPQARPEWIDEEAERQFTLLQETITAAREIRATMKLDSKRKVAADFSSVEYDLRELIKANRQPVLRLASLSDLRVSGEPLQAAGGTVRSTARFDMRVASAEAVDIATEMGRLRKEMERLERDVESKKHRLEDATFLSKAPHHIIKGLRDTFFERQIELKKIKQRLEQIENNA
ncbi:MAG TPA: valine--tRNA ligase [Candidatus Acidoferrales bacterium]|nr:valine--tRNA ligase [Candidatus Acidoferrales bacterium]